MRCTLAKEIVVDANEVTILSYLNYADKIDHESTTGLIDIAS